MKSTLTAFVALATVAVAASTTHAQLLQVDINSTNSGAGPNQAGWNGWLINQNFGSPLNENVSFAYSGATDGTIEINLSTTTNGGGRSYGIDNVTDPGNLTIPDVWSDQAFFNNNTGGTMTLTFDDLTAGTYDFTSYSYADNLAASSNDDGIASISVDTGSGFVDTGLDVTFVSGGNGYAPVTAALLDSISTAMFSFTVDNDGDSVSILYDDLNVNGGDTFGLNGFQLQQQQAVPEPASIALWSLLGLALAGFSYYRVRRKN